MDKNFIIGLVLIMLMLIGYQMLVPQPVEPTPVSQVEKQAVRPSEQNNPSTDSLQVLSPNGDSSLVAVAQQDLVIETVDAKIVFSNKGGILKEVSLKKYKTYDQKPLFLIAENHNEFDLELPTQSGNVKLTNLYFSTENKDQSLSEKDSVTISYKVDLKNGQSVEQTYVVRGSGYVIDYGIKANGMSMGDKSLLFNWRNDLLQLENDMAKNREVVTINYYTDDLNSLATSTTSNEAASAEAPVKWFTLKHKYFLAGLIAKKQPFNKFEMKADVNPNDSIIVKTMDVAAAIPMSAVQKGEANYQFYLGPNDYHLVKNIAAENFDQNVYLGYAFLKPINKFVLVPLFNFLE